MNPQRLKWLWMLALLVAVANMLAVVWRLPVQKRLANDADEQAVQEAAQWIAPLPADTRLLLLASNQDPTYFHFHTRLIYFLYPHRIDIALNHLPSDAISHYDGILAFGHMVGGLEANSQLRARGWQVAGHDSRAAFLLSSRYVYVAPESLPASRLPLPIRLLSGLFSLAVVVVLGALLLNLTLRAPPFSIGWANLAVAHLVGAAAFAIIQHLCILMVGKPLVWPVYAVLVAALFIVALTPAPLRQNVFPKRSRNMEHGGEETGDLQDDAEKLQWRFGRRGTNLTTNQFNVQPQGALNVNTSNSPLPGFFGRGAGGEGYYYAACLLGIITVLERAWLIGLDWDALAIWQLKAKMLFWDGNLTAWQHTAPFPYAHFDYPLLTPLLTWWTYRHFDAMDLHWAQANGLLFYADLLIIFAVSACRYVPPSYALLGTAILSGLPEVTLHAVSGYADLPVAAYFLGAGVFLIRALVEREPEAWPLVGWMLAGVILVKNEGLLACASVFLVIAWYMLSVRRASISICADTAQIKETDASAKPKYVTEQMAVAKDSNTRTERARLWWMSAPALAYLPWWLLKHQWQLTNDVMQPVHPPHFTIRLLWWRMWYAILLGFGKQMLWLGPWFPAWGLFGVIVVAGMAAMYRRRVALAHPLWLLAGIQTIGYIGIYMITPAALPAHIISSVDRLTLHITPTLLLAALLSCFAEGKVHNENVVQTPAQTE